MSFYHIQEDMEIFLKSTLDNLIDTKRQYLLQDISITWVNYHENTSNQKGFGCSFNNKKRIYPASIVKLVYALAIYKWIEQDQLIFNEQIDDAVCKMLQHSSNDATSFVIDMLTGTSSGPSLEGEKWENWKHQRQIINDWLSSFNWKELDGFNCCQKTWEDQPFGREKDFYGEENENINLMTTEGTGRILEEIMRHIEFDKNNVNLKSYLSRELNKEIYKKDTNNQIEGFLGEGLPENISFWSKAGLMSKVRHDAVWWTNNDLTNTLLIVFGNNPKFVQDQLIFPMISQRLYRYINKSTY